MKGFGRSYLCLDKIIEKHPFLLRSVRNTLLVLFKVRVMLTTGRAGEGLLSQSLVPLVLGRYERSCCFDWHFSFRSYFSKERP